MDTRWLQLILFLVTGMILRGDFTSISIDPLCTFKNDHANCYQGVPVIDGRIEMYYDDKKECTISFNSSNHVSKFIRDQSFFGNSFDSIDGCSSTAVYTSASVTGPAGLNIRFHLDELGDLGKDWFEVEILQNIVNLQIILDTLNPADTITSDYRLTTHGDFNAAGSLFAKKSVKYVEVSPERLRGTPMIDLIRAQLITYNLVCTMLADVNKRHTFQWDINSDISLSPHYLSPDDCENDKANEIVLRNIRSGKYIRVYDNPEMKRNDDWIEIIASGSIDKATINPLEEIDANLRRKVRQNGNLIVKYHTGDNSDFLSGSDFDGDLSGKVSYVEISSVAAPPLIDLFEGNDATGHFQCSLAYEAGNEVDFQESFFEQGQIAAEEGCLNDETRSIAFWDLTPGLWIRLLGAPKGKLSEDWAEFYIKENVDYYILRSLQSGDGSKWVDKTQYQARYHTGDGSGSRLDGKLTYVQFDTAPKTNFIDLFEGDDNTQGFLCSFSTSNFYTSDFTEHYSFDGYESNNGCENDEARSMAFWGVQPGKYVRFFDRSDSGVKKYGDDWVEIYFKEFVEWENEVEVEEPNQLKRFKTDDSRYEIKYHTGEESDIAGQPALKGKISRGEVSDSPAGPFIDLFEGNYQLEEMMCSIRVTDSFVYDFKQTSTFCNANQDNDECRSIALWDVGKGTFLRFYGEPLGGKGEDWVEFEILEDISYKRLDSLQANNREKYHHSSWYTARYHTGDGELDYESRRSSPTRLDGKVSYLEMGRSSRVGFFDLFERENAGQGFLCSISQTEHSSDFKSRWDFTGAKYLSPEGCEENEAVSFVVWGVKAGTYFRLFDSNDAVPARYGDDFMEFYAKEDIEYQVISSVEEKIKNRRFVDEVKYSIRYHTGSENGGLDTGNPLAGKVSFAEVRSSGVGPTIDFFEADNSFQEMKCSVPTSEKGIPSFMRFTSPTSWCPNDEVRSMTLWDYPAGTYIRLYDSDSIHQDEYLRDDWLEIHVKETVNGPLYVPYFQEKSAPSRFLTTPSVDVRYHTGSKNGGIDTDNPLSGKVSAMRIRSERFDPVLDVFNELNGNGVMKCSLKMSVGLSIELCRDDCLCDNDVAASLGLWDIAAGTVIQLFDSPDGSLKDDWIDIHVRTETPYIHLSSLQKSTSKRLSNSIFDVRYHSGNDEQALNGKVSLIRTRASPRDKILTFFSGFNLGGNMLCSFETDDSEARYQVLTESSSIYGYESYQGCDNDEIRSFAIHRVPAGTYITIYDLTDSGVEKMKDDWMEVHITSYVEYGEIDSIENRADKYAEYNGYSVRYHTSSDNDLVLAGKASIIQIRSEPMGGIVDFYEGVGHSQRKFCSIKSSNTHFEFGGRSTPDCTNDEAKSMTLFDIPMGTYIRLYDSYNYEIDDDWMELYVKRSVPYISVYDFEANSYNMFVENDDYWIRYHNGDNADALNGRVSSVRISTVGEGPIIDFFQEGSRRGEMVCSVRVKSLMSTFSSLGCGNDNVWSFNLFYAPVGTYIRIFDSPSTTNSRYGDDWMELYVKQSSYISLNSLQTGYTDKSSSYANYDVHYHTGNDGVALSGRASLLEISTSSIGPHVDFFENSNGNDYATFMCTVLHTSSTTSVNFNGANDFGCYNDAVNAISLWNIKAGTYIRLYNGNDYRINEPFTEIHVKRDVEYQRISSLESVSSGNNYDITYFGYYGGGVEGKVSTVQISDRSIGPVVSFYSTTYEFSYPINGGYSTYVYCGIGNNLGCRNDQIRWVAFFNVPAGYHVKLFDRPERGSSRSSSYAWEYYREDDYAIIETKKLTGRGRSENYYVYIEDAYPESDSVDHWRRHVFHHNNGLYGKVSTIRVTRTADPPRAVLYEGNKGDRSDLQNICCTVRLDRSRSFKLTDNNYPDTPEDYCDNDEIRSVRFFDGYHPGANDGDGGGMMLRMYDNPDGDTNRDYSRACIYGSVNYRTLNVESSSSRYNIDYDFYDESGWGFAGKISRIVTSDSNTHCKKGVGYRFSFTFRNDVIVTEEMEREQKEYIARYDALKWASEEEEEIASHAPGWLDGPDPHVNLD